MNKLWGAACVLLLCTGLAIAGGPGAVRKQVESSLLVTGTVDIEPDGSVGSYVLDRAEELPSVVARMMDRATPLWRFEPILQAGKPVRARTDMTVRIVATQQADGGYTARLAGANFGESVPGEWVRGKTLEPPAYPSRAADNGIRGTVYVVVRVGRDGRVEDATAEQVNLRVIDDEKSMDRWREMLAKAAVDAARRWTFNLPTHGEEMDLPFWLSRVPVDFVFDGDEPTKYGQWEAYVPGPKQTVPWIGSTDTSVGADAFAAGGVYPVGGGPRLLTPIGG